MIDLQQQLEKSDDNDDLEKPPRRGKVLRGWVADFIFAPKDLSEGSMAVVDWQFHANQHSVII